MKIFKILLLLMICHDSKESYIKIEQIKWTQVVNEEFLSFQVENDGNKNTSVGIFTVHKNIKNFYVSNYWPKIHDSLEIYLI